jgi:hypothetical protein
MRNKQHSTRITTSTQNKPCKSEPTSTQNESKQNKTANQNPPSTQNKNKPLQIKNPQAPPKARVRDLSYLALLIICYVEH